MSEAIMKDIEHKEIAEGEDLLQFTEDNTEEVAEAEEIEEIIERPYTLRKLKDGDLFPLLQIFKKIGVKDFKDSFIQMASGEKSLKDVGISVFLDMADVLISNIPKAEEEIYKLWGDISGIEPWDIKDMEFGTLPLMIIDTFKEMRNTAFFKVLSKLL